jgi:septal ring factor EnvC (AmiA/AmiB activator)
MAYTLTEAAKATGLNKTTIFRAIRKGLISATRDATSGQWSVEPAELHRVYPLANAVTASNDAQAPIALPRNDAAVAEIREIRALLATTEARLADAQDQITDLRRRLDAADAERRQTAERLTALLTDQREQVRRSWWHWGRR